MTTSSTTLVPVAFDVLSIATVAVCATGVEYGSLAVTGPAVAVVPVTVPVLLIVPALMSAWVTV